MNTAKEIYEAARGFSSDDRKALSASIKGGLSVDVSLEVMMLMGDIGCLPEEEKVELARLFREDEANKEPVAKESTVQEPDAEASSAKAAAVQESAEEPVAAKAPDTAKRTKPQQPKKIARKRSLPGKSVGPLHAEMPHVQPSAPASKENNMMMPLILTGVGLVCAGLVYLGIHTYSATCQTHVAIAEAQESLQSYQNSAADVKRDTVRLLADFDRANEDLQQTEVNIQKTREAEASVSGKLGVQKEALNELSSQLKELSEKEAQLQAKCQS